MSLTACLLPPWLPPQGKLSRVSRSGVVLETISLDEGFITWSLISGPAPQQQRQQQQQQGQGQQQQQQQGQGQGHQEQGKGHERGQPLALYSAADIAYESEIYTEVRSGGGGEG